MDAFPALSLRGKTRTLRVYFPRERIGLADHSAKPAIPFCMLAMVLACQVARIACAVYPFR
jgi:hypothetical protein